MHLKMQQRNGRTYLSIVQNYRQGGKTRTRTVETIGYADDYADRFEDPVAHFRAYVDQLNRNAAKRNKPVELSFAHDDEIDAQSAPPARLGAAIALGCLDALGVGGYFRARASRAGFPPHAGRIFEMLAVERMMHATSKRESWAARESFPRRCDFTFAQVYEALSCFAKEQERLDACMLRHWELLGGAPSTERVFLICGSYAFPIDGGSERASIAVALDHANMPLGYHDMTGRPGPALFREAVDELKERLGAKRAVVVAGGLRDLQPTIEELASTNDGFALYQRDFGKIPELSEWAEDDEGYVAAGGGVFLKSRVVDHRLADGSSLPVKQVVLRGGGYATRYKQAMLVSSEVDLSATAIVQLYRELWRQAEPFQPLEADFSSMPHPTPASDHIRAHFALCYAAFFALRVLRWGTGWQHNAADTADALLRMEGIYLQQNYYLFNYRSQASDAIENALGLPPALRLRTRSEIRSVPAPVKRALAGGQARQKS